MSTSYTQQFSCDESVLLSQNNRRPPTKLYDVDNQGGVVFNEVIKYPLTLNAFGFNFYDGKIYAASSSGNIYRLHSDGTYDLLGRDPSGGGLSLVAGEVDREGRYVTTNRNSGVLKIYDVQNGLNLKWSTNLYWDPSSGNSGSLTKMIADLVVHPTRNDVLVSFQQYFIGPSRTRGHILLININPTSSNFGMVTPMFRVQPSMVQAMGGMFINEDGEILAYGKNTGVGTPHRRLVKIDLANEDVILLGTGPSATGTDGCSCPLPLKFSKEVTNVIAGCDSICITYRLLINNKSVFKYHDLKLTDTLARGGVISKVLDDLSDIKPSISNDRRSLSSAINILHAKDSMTLTFEVKIPAHALPYSNQALLTGSWSELERSIVSDDPTTPIVNDSTRVTEDLIDYENRMTTSLYENHQICEGDTLNIHNLSITKEGTFTTDTFGGNLCDTIIKVNVDFYKKYKVRDTSRLCQGDSLFFFGQWLKQSGTYNQKLQSIHGCDSIIKLYISVEDTLQQSITRRMCPGESLIIKNLNIDTFGRYSTKTNGVKCDTFWDIHVLPPQPVDLSFEEEPSCPGEDSGHLEVLFSSPSNIDSFYWSTGDTTTLIANLSSGSYTLHVQDSFGCWSSFDYQVDTVDIPDLNIDLVDADCHSDFIGTVDVSSSDSTSLFAFNDGLFSSDNTYTSHPGTSVKITHKFMGCTEDTTVALSLIDTLYLDIDHISTGDCGSDVILKLNTSERGAVAAFDITGVDSAKYNSSNLSYNFKLFQNQKIRATVRDTHGCLYQRTLDINLEGDSRIWVPNVFTPNGDNLNDVFHIYASDCVQRIEKFLIYDRWGEHVFEAYDFLPGEKGWNGLLNERDMNPGVYTYYVVYIDHSGKSGKLMGSVTLLE
ncbi:MAG: gliding motility-associated C-terminal domain-containing protein [Saprospiraceae bacterium]|nr:gliding motility-associated C-terminal domain-containing protein [Saprospiraceae bacterium]